MTKGAIAERRIKNILKFLNEKKAEISDSPKYAYFDDEECYDLCDKIYELIEVHMHRAPIEVGEEAKIKKLLKLWAQLPEAENDDILKRKLKGEIEKMFGTKNQNTNSGDGMIEKLRSYLERTCRVATVYVKDGELAEDKKIILENGVEMMKKYIEVLSDGTIYVEYSEEAVKWAREIHKAVAKWRHNVEIDTIVNNMNTSLDATLQHACEEWEKLSNPSRVSQDVKSKVQETIETIDKTDVFDRLSGISAILENAKEFFDTLDRMYKDLKVSDVEQYDFIEKEISELSQEENQVIRDFRNGLIDEATAEKKILNIENRIEDLKAALENIQSVLGIVTDEKRALVGRVLFFMPLKTIFETYRKFYKTKFVQFFGPLPFNLLTAVLTNSATEQEANIVLAYIGEALTYLRQGQVPPETLKINKVEKVPEKNQRKEKELTPEEVAKREKIRAKLYGNSAESEVKQTVVTQNKIRDLLHGDNDTGL